MRRPKGLMPMENMLEYGPLPLPGGYQVLAFILCNGIGGAFSIFIIYNFSPEEAEEAKSIRSIWWEKVSLIPVYMSL